MRINGEVKFKNHDWNISAEVLPVLDPPGWLVMVKTIQVQPHDAFTNVTLPQEFKSFENAIKHAATIVGMDLN